MTSGAAWPRSLLNGQPALQTSRLILREADTRDAAFFLQLLNEPAFLKHIGDRGVRNLADARRYIQDGPVASYTQHGFGIYVVALKEAGALVGACGLIQRENLSDPDLGFAFLPEYWSQGFALEASQAVIDRSERVLGLRRILAVASPDNSSSIRLLTRLGFVQEEKLDFFGDSGKCNLYCRES